MDDVVSGLTENQIQVKYCVILLGAMGEGAWHFWVTVYILDVKP